MVKKEIIAMILAGGQGSRLIPLTEKIAKPAVPFGGRYRIIDFPLSNCCNSGIDTVGVLTQYEPHLLNQHISTGTPWDLNRQNGGVTVLQPHTTKVGGGWYKGTANAIYQNMPYIDSYSPEYVLILSGDHIYKMDYSKMLNFHKRKNSDATIAVLEVPLKEASRFGIMNTDSEGKIYEFEEKPKVPKSTLASMGIYIFNWKALKKLLIEDEAEKKSENDFGKNIIPKMIEKNYSLNAYNFEGYWKDVGTIDSLWEAHMDLLNQSNNLNIYDNNWKIYTRQESYPPQYLGKDAVIKNSIVDEGCEIEGTVENSVIFSGVKIGKNSKVIDSVVMKNTIIGKNVIINKTIIATDVKIGDDLKIGTGEDIVVIADKKEIL
ncbi:MAG: glucose-1-phosphate adenylyltransferase [Cetobacterium sp.]|uniref:glucose-1-phosphate adenylyltransferase n=1 Tax=unclassified Cetobacterium TaxID=2630983 RepID=UPI00163C7A00|nr:glucose-1-phosphate adenylyltransferase [Cetobacterium sp. 2A]MBC2856453.1 glucose-1-phosphate adenylyltransferase [Cetobacterium sp. 2A]